jgi:hypothetical protein
VSNELNNDLKSNAAVLVLLLSLGPLAPHNAFAQQANPQAAAARKKLRRLLLQFCCRTIKIQQNHGLQYGFQIAFQACSTEEQAIGVLLTANNVQRETVAALLIKIKLDLKKSIRDIAANPSRYLK